jgi:hypothetical protein
VTRVSTKTVDQFDVSALSNATGGAITWRAVTVTDTNGDGTGDAILTFPNGESVVLQGVTADEASGKQNSAAIGIPCLASGTPVLTPGGWRRVETIRQGDLVHTAKGIRPVLWAEQRKVTADELTRHPEHPPIHFPVGTIGNARSLRLSPQHAVLLRTKKAKTVLVRAKHLARLGLGGALIAKGICDVTYHHVTLDRHDILCCAGAPTESFFPGQQAMAMRDCRRWPFRPRMVLPKAVSGWIGAMRPDTATFLDSNLDP